MGKPTRKLRLKFVEGCKANVIVELEAKDSFPNSLLDEQNLALAESLLRRAVARAPAEGIANHTLYRCLIQMGKTSDAEQCQARFQEAEKDIKKMAALMRQLKVEPDDPERRCQVAEIFLRHNQESEGERWLLTTLQIHPDHGPTHKLLADYYRRIGRNDLAQQHQHLAK